MTFTPTRIVALSFAGAIVVGTLLLLLPISHAEGDGTTFVEALFTSTSAICLTGLIVVDTPHHWSGFGHGVLLGLMQVGGLGIMTMASLVGLLLANRIGLRARLNTAAETRSAGGIGDVRSVIIGVVRLSLVTEAVIAVPLTLRFLFGYDESFGRALWLGVFHSVSAFNNAGFALFSDSMMRFVDDPWICLPLMAAVVIGGLGFPVLFELRRNFRNPRPPRWSVHTRLTVVSSAILLVGGAISALLLEWGRTQAAMSFGERLLASTFQSVMARSAGFNSIDYADMDPATLLINDVLMFIGAGSGGTGGGIKVTTFALLLFVIFAEVRGERTVTVFDRTMDTRVQRQALSVALLGVALVMAPTIILVSGTDFDLNQVLFEVISASATVGLSTGITAALPEWAQVMLVLLMYVGRIGSITLVGALAARIRTKRFQYPDERPLIG